MKKYTLKEIAALIDGQLIIPEGFTDKEYEQIIIDSRVMFQKETTIFFAIKGIRNNGHNYISDLLLKGIDAFVVSEPNSVTPRAAYILVDNTTIALHKIAAANRDKYSYPIMGITGSNGKTIVKEWLYELLSSNYKIIRSPKSYNSQTGVPLSVLLMDENFNLGIFEAGISQPGEMQKLAGIISPTIGILTNIGDAHQENFISKEDKLLEKLKLFSTAEKLIYNADDTEMAIVIHDFCKKNNIEPVAWSITSDSGFIHFRLHRYDNNTVIKATVDGKVYEFEINMTDNSAIENACHCFAAIYAMTKEPLNYLQQFKNLEPVAMRLEIKKGINNCILINDYYNSDLASLAIALSVLDRQAQQNDQKKILILSDIRQTGIPSHELYKQVNKLLDQWQLDQLIGIGPEISLEHECFTGEKEFYATTETFLAESGHHRFNNSIVLIKGAREFTFEKISAAIQQKNHQTRLEINLNSLVHNLNVYRSLLYSSTKIMVMVKAFSYGSGDVEIARALQYEHIDYLAVAVADEGIELRRAGINVPILVMNPEEESFNGMIEFNLEPNIYNLELLRKFEKSVIQNARSQYPVHIKLDTGMNRLGFKTDHDLDTCISILTKNNNMIIQSVFSHLAAADDNAFDQFTLQQIDQFMAWSKKITTSFDYKIDRHLLNSAGIERFPQWQFDMVRLGIGLYGVSATGLNLKNISTFKSIVSQVKVAYRGETAGYSRKEIIRKETEIAVVPVGYADGLSRILGNRNGAAYVKGNKVPVIGNICMDMLMLDVTGMNVQRGDEVEFFGHHIPLTEIAEKAGTIPYEILTGISQRVKRIYHYE